MALFRSRGAGAGADDAEDGGSGECRPLVADRLPCSGGSVAGRSICSDPPEASGGSGGSGLLSERCGSCFRWVLPCCCCCCWLGCRWCGR